MYQVAAIPNTCIHLSLFFSGNHTIAEIKGKEEHGTLKESLSNVIRDVNHLNDQGNIVVDGRHIELEFYLGGDYMVKNHRMQKVCFLFTTKA